MFPMKCFFHMCLAGPLTLAHNHERGSLCAAPQSLCDATTLLQRLVSTKGDEKAKAGHHCHPGTMEGSCGSQKVPIPENCLLPNPTRCAGMDGSFELFSIQGGYRLPAGRLGHPSHHALWAGQM
jgi:hypothetical protein